MPWRGNVLEVAQHVAKRNAGLDLFFEFPPRSGRCLSVAKIGTQPLRGFKIKKLALRPQRSASLHTGLRGYIVPPAHKMRWRNFFQATTTLLHGLSRSNVSH